MAGFTNLSTRPLSVPTRRAYDEPPLVKYGLIAFGYATVAIILLLPLAAVFTEALSKGWDVAIKALTDKDTLHSIQLTLLVAAIVVPLNTIFGLASAWALANFRFKGRALLTSLIELPLWISPVVGGLVYVLIFGQQGWFGGWFVNNMPIIFAPPGLIIATAFVTFPMVARSLLPLMEAQGSAEEEAALTLGANGWQIFTQITLPKIKWGLLYGVILCNARSMGEFGAVSVVSGHIRGQTETMPLQVQSLYEDGQFAAAFTVSAMLTLLAMFTLLIKTYIEWNARRQAAAGEESQPAAINDSLIVAYK